MADKKDAEQANERVENVLDAEQARGYRGLKADPTPNEHYTVAGVTSGKPTPETDADAAAQVGSSKFNLSAGDKA
jgi:hypothetical protein